MSANAPFVTYGQIITAHARQIEYNTLERVRRDMAFGGMLNDPFFAYYGLGSRWRAWGQGLSASISDAIANHMLYRQAKSVWSYHAPRTPTLEELSAKTADLSRRIDAAKAKHGVA